MTTDYAVNIMQVFKSATPDNFAAGYSWYRDAQRLASEIANGDVWKGAGVLACFSPRQPWPINVRNARAALACGTAAGHRPALHTRQQVKSADLIIRNHWTLDVLKGDKTRAFATCIATGGQCADVAIDRHAHDIAMGHHEFTDSTRNIGKRLYRELSAAYREVADYLDLTAPEVQAITWEAWRESKGTWAVWRDSAWIVGTPETGMTVSVPA